MPKAKKTAKVAHKSIGQTDSDELVSSRLIMIDRTHRVAMDGSGKTNCGQYGQGWKYGTVEQVTCEECLDA